MEEGLPAIIFAGWLLYEEFKAADVLYFLKGGVSDPDIMRALAQNYDWHGGEGVLKFDDIGATVRYMNEILLPKLREGAKNVL